MVVTLAVSVAMPSARMNLSAVEESKPHVELRQSRSKMYFCGADETTPTWNQTCHGCEIDLSKLTSKDRVDLLSDNVSDTRLYT